MRLDGKHIDIRYLFVGNTFYLSTIHGMMRMDETDVKILGKLLSDARLSYRRIADEIGVSPPTVLARVKKLESDSVIKGYSAILDHEKLGYDLTAIIEVTSVKGKI